MLLLGGGDAIAQCLQLIEDGLRNLVAKLLEVLCSIFSFSLQSFGIDGVHLVPFFLA